jgi:uncharacterized protein DUF6503
MNSKYVIVVMVIALMACKQTPKEYPQTDPEAQRIIDETIKVYGGENYNFVKIEFDFRSKSYGSLRRDRDYIYARIFTEDEHLVQDLLSNDGLTREIDGTPEKLSSLASGKYTNSINSVIYFALLPYGLNDEAVIKQYLGEKEIEGKNYHKILVTFKQEGGGEDHNDEFVYWINKENNSMDYFAYGYYTDGGGTRFRKAYNKRTVGGITFQDYINYKGGDDFDHVNNMDETYVNGELKEISRIELKSVMISKITAGEFLPDALK